MARLARLVIPGLPHHVTQRGNGRAQTFFEDADYRLYLTLLAAACHEADVAVWSWVLMPNHVHLVLVPETADGLRRALARVHRDYAGHVHARDRRSGHFWQGRFGAVVMDEAHLVAALRYIARNPVRAQLVNRPEAWPWSSVHAHLTGVADGMTAIAPVRARIPDFAAFIAADDDERDAAPFARLRQAESVGRPLGGDQFLTRIETLTRRVVRPAKRGPKPAAARAVGDEN